MSLFKRDQRPLNPLKLRHACKSFLSLTYFMFVIILGWHVGQTRVPDVGPGVFREGPTGRGWTPQTPPASLAAGLFARLTFPQSTGKHSPSCAESVSLSFSRSALEHCWPLLSESHWVDTLCPPPPLPHPLIFGLFPNLIDARGLESAAG